MDEIAIRISKKENSAKNLNFDKLWVIKFFTAKTDIWVIGSLT